MNALCRSRDGAGITPQTRPRARDGSRHEVVDESGPNDGGCHPASTRLQIKNGQRWLLYHSALIDCDPDRCQLRTIGTANEAPLAPFHQLVHHPVERPQGRPQGIRCNERDPNRRTVRGIARGDPASADCAAAHRPRTPARRAGSRTWSRACRFEAQQGEQDGRAECDGHEQATKGE